MKLYSKHPEMEKMIFTQSQARSRSPGVSSPNQQPLSSDTTSRDQRKKSTSGALEPVPQSIMNLVNEHDRRANSGTAFFERRPRVVELSDTINGPSKGGTRTFEAGSNNLNRENDLSSNGDDQSCTGVEQSAATENRWQLASLAVANYPALTEDSRTLHADSAQYLRINGRELVAPRIPNWPGDDLLRNVGGLVVGMVLWFASLAYGALHAAAWNDTFPSDAEMWLWRASSCYIAFCGLLWVVLNYAAQKHKPTNDFWENWMDGKGAWWQNILIGIPVVICGLSFFVVRGYIVIEAFISVRCLPAEAYLTPSWTSVFPHF